MNAQTTQSLPARILETITEILGNLLDSTQQLIAENFMDVLLGVLTLILGWMIASVCRGLSSKLARAAGVDVISDRSGLRRFLLRNDVTKPLSKYIGVFVYAIIIYAITNVALETMGLYAVADFLRKLAGYIPQAGVVFLLLALGVGLGKVVKGLCTRAARMSGLPMPEFLGSFCRLAVILFAFFLSLNYLELASESVLLSGFALVIGVAFGLSILFTLAARTLMESLLCHPFLKATYRKGDYLTCDNFEGKVVKIDATVTHLQQGEDLHILPNRLIATHPVQVIKNSTPSA